MKPTPQTPTVTSVTIPRDPRNVTPMSRGIFAAIPLMSRKPEVVPCRKLAREPTRLVRSWRAAAARAAAPFWKQYGLVDLKVRDANLHARLLAAIADLDLACAAENDQRIAAAGAGLVATWCAVATVMKIEEAANGEESGAAPAVKRSSAAAGRHARPQENNLGNCNHYGR